MARYLAPFVGRDGVTHLLDLARYSLREPGDPLLILGPEVFGRTPERACDSAELIGELALALTQTRARPVARLATLLTG